MTSEQKSLLCEAAKKLKETELKKFAKIRALYRCLKATAGVGTDREQFEHLFADFYKVSSRYVTEDFKGRYFELLFSADLSEDHDGYHYALTSLLPFKRKNGKQALECSFVSKLIATRDELRPLYDIHVSAFFGVFVPRVGSPAFRIDQWLENLDAIQQRYAGWVKDADFHATIQGVKERHSLLDGVPDVRICDLLVWTVGREKLWPKPTIESK